MVLYCRHLLITHLHIDDHQQRRQLYPATLPPPPPPVCIDLKIDFPHETLTGAANVDADIIVVTTI